MRIYFALFKYPTHPFTHTHTRLTALCPGLPGWDGTRKVKPIWILLEQEIVSSSGISWACASLHLAPGLANGHKKWLFSSFLNTQIYDILSVHKTCNSCPKYFHFKRIYTIFVRTLQAHNAVWILPYAVRPWTWEFCYAWCAQLLPR